MYQDEGPPVGRVGTLERAHELARARLINHSASEAPFGESVDLSNRRPPRRESTQDDTRWPYRKTH
jgi:hypothetical protein